MPEYVERVQLTMDEWRQVQNDLSELDALRKERLLLWSVLEAHGIVGTAQKKIEESG